MLRRIGGRRPATLIAALATVLIALPGAASGAALRPAIEGGQNAVEGQAPWNSVALVQAQVDGGTIVCSGTVVAPTLVLTAGHCAFDPTTDALIPGAAYSVMTGGVSWLTDPLDGPFSPGPGGVISSVSQVIPDPSFAWVGAVADHDAALLELTTPTTAPVIRLATPADSALYAPGANVETAGWGLTSPYADDIPQTLQWVNTVLYSQAECGGSYTFDSADQICTHNTNGAGTCEGDSGGPLVATGQSGVATEIGITSYGPDDACDTTFEANVSALSSWISPEIGALAPLTATSLPASWIGQTGATLNGSLTQVGDDASYQFQYGTTSGYGQTTAAVRTNGGSSAASPLTLLQPGTTYHYRLVVTDTNGPAAYGADETFTTLPRPRSSTRSGTGTPTARKPRAGTYRGSIARYGLIRLKVAPNRTSVSGISLRIGLRCTRLRGVSTHNLVLTGSHRLTTAHGFGLRSSFVIRRNWHYRLTATFTKTGKATGTVSVIAEHQRTGTCRSGTLHWKADV